MKEPIYHGIREGLPEFEGYYFVYFTWDEDDLFEDKGVGFWNGSEWYADSTERKQIHVTEWLKDYE